MARRYPQLESEGAHGCRGAPRRALHRRPEVAPGSGDGTAIRMDALPSPLVRGRLARTGPFRDPIGTRGRNARVPARRARRRPREQPRRRRAGTLLTRAPAGATSPAELAALCARDDRLGSLYRSLRELSEEYAEDIRRGHPRRGPQAGSAGRGGLGLQPGDSRAPPARWPQHLSQGVSLWRLLLGHRPLLSCRVDWSDQRHFSDPNEILEGPTRSWGLPSWRPSVLISTLPL